MTAMLLCKS